MQVTSPSALTTALQGLTREGDLERYLLKIASAEVLHLIKPGGPEKSAARSSCSAAHFPHAHSSQARTRDITLRIYRLRGLPAAPRGQRVRRWGRGASASLWILRTEPERGSRRLNGAANPEGRREQRSPRTGAG